MRSLTLTTLLATLFCFPVCLRAMDGTLTREEELPAEAKPLLSPIVKPLCLLEVDEEDSQTALLKYALDLKKEHAKQLLLRKQNQEQSSAEKEVASSSPSPDSEFDAILANFGEKSFPSCYVGPLVKMAVARLTNLAHRKVAHYSSLNEAECTPKLIETIIEVAFKPIITAEIVKLGQFESSIGFVAECLTRPGFQLTRTDIWLPPQTSYPPARWPQAIETILKLHADGPNFDKEVTLFQNRGEFGINDPLKGLKLYQYLALSIIDLLTQPAIDDEEFDYYLIENAPPSQVLLEYKLGIVPQKAARAVSCIPKPLSLLKAEGEDVQIALIQYALRFPEAPEGPFPREQIDSNVKKAVDHLRELILKSVAEDETFPRDPQIISLFIDILCKPFLIAELTKRSQFGLEFDSRCLLNGALRRTDIWPPRLGQILPSRLPRALSLLLSEIGKLDKPREKNLITVSDTGLETVPEFKKALEGVEKLSINQLNILLLLQSLFKVVDAYLDETPPEETMLPMPELMVQNAIPRCGLLLSSALHIDSTKRMLACMHAAYRSLRKWSMPKDVCCIILALTDFGDLSVGAKSQNQEVAVEQTAESIFAQQTKRLALANISSLEDSVGFYTFQASPFEEALLSHTCFLVQQRFLELAKRIFSFIQDKWYPDFIESTDDQDAATARYHKYLKAIEAEKEPIYLQLASGIVDHAMTCKVARTIFNSYIKAFQEKRVPNVADHFPLCDTSNWKNLIKTVLTDYKDATAPELTVPPASLDKEVRRNFENNSYMETLGWWRGLDLAPYPFCLIFNQNFIATLNQAQKKALLVVITLADLEELLQAFHQLNDTYQFNNSLQTTHKWGLSAPFPSDSGSHNHLDSTGKFNFLIDFITCHDLYAGSFQRQEWKEMVAEEISDCSIVSERRRPELPLIPPKKSSSSSN